MAPQMTWRRCFCCSNSGRAISIRSKSMQASDHDDDVSDFIENAGFKLPWPSSHFNENCSLAELAVHCRTLSLAQLPVPVQDRELHEQMQEAKQMANQSTE